MPTYQVRTRNWNNNPRAARRLGNLSRFGVKSWPGCDKHVFETDNLTIAKRFYRIFRKLARLTGGMTWLDEIAGALHKGHDFEISPMKGALS